MQTSVVRGIALALTAPVLAACAGSGAANPSPAPTAPPLQGVVASSEVYVGQNLRVAFGVLDRNGIPVADASVSVQIFSLPAAGSGQQPAPLGPAAPAPYKGALLQGKGVYVIHQTFDHPGFYRAQINASKGPLSTTTEASFTVQPSDQVVPIGAPAPRTQNATANQIDDIRKIDTSGQDDGMHYVSVADAIAARHVTVVYLGSPGFCVSRTCAPEVDVVKSLIPKYKPIGVDFCHIETYKNGVPNADRSNINPWFDEWKLQSDPWVFVVDRDGVVRAHFDGPTTADEIEPAIAQLTS